jgi:hypothetical protein
MPKMKLPDSFQEAKQTGEAKPESASTKIGTSLALFLQLPQSETNLEAFSKYWAYYDRTWAALKQGDPPESEIMDIIQDEHIQRIVNLISKEIISGRPCQRETLRETLERDLQFDHHSEDSINRTIDLSLRLWLVMNVRDDDFAPGVHSIQWDDSKSLQLFIASQFPKPRLFKELIEKMFDFVLPDNFTIVKLKRYSGIKIDWTYDLSEHLDLDKDHRILKVFPLKAYMYGLRKRSESPSRKEVLLLC